MFASWGPVICCLSDILLLLSPKDGFGLILNTLKSMVYYKYKCYNSNFCCLTLGVILILRNVSHNPKSSGRRLSITGFDWNNNLFLKKISFHIEQYCLCSVGFVNAVLLNCMTCLIAGEKFSAISPQLPAVNRLSVHVRMTQCSDSCINRQLYCLKLLLDFIFLFLLYFRIPLVSFQTE